MLGADLLGLALEAVDEGIVLVVSVPPLDSIDWAGGGDRGAIAGIWGMGAAMADEGSGASGTGVLWVAAATAAAAAA